MSRAKLIVNGIREAVSNFMNGGLDNKRTRLWCEFGFKDKLEFEDFYQAYKRNGLAYGAVDKVVKKCWSKYPQLYEGNRSEEDEVNTEYENAINNTLGDDFWSQFKEADRRRMIGRWSALVLYWNDQDTLGWGDPVRDGSRLSFVRACWSSNLHPITYDENAEPLTWEYIPPAINGIQGTPIIMHRSRVFILGDYTEDGMSFLEAGFNNLVSIEKVEGGSSESYLKNSARQLHLNFDSEADDPTNFSGEQEDGKEFKKSMEKAVKDLNAGNDTLLITQGASSRELVSNVPDPFPTYNINVMSFASSVDIPMRILVGNQTGERATVEDLKYFNSMCQERRLTTISDDIKRFMRHLLDYRMFDKRRINVKWDDLTTPTQVERLDNTAKMVVINKEAIFSGSDPVFTHNEVRTEAGYDTSTDNSSL